MVACNTCLSLYLERMLVRPVSLSLFYRAAQRGASRAPLALSLSLVPRGEVVQTLQISGVKSGVIWTTS